MEDIQVKKALIWLLCLWSLWLPGETLLEYLEQVRQNASHHGMGVMMRSCRDVELENGGSSEELSWLFHEELERAGYSSTVMSGQVLMDGEQFAQWSPGICHSLAHGAILESDGKWRVPMTWVRCRACRLPALTGLLGENTEQVDIFPGLLCAEKMTEPKKHLSSEIINNACTVLNDQISGDAVKAACLRLSEGIFDISVTMDSIFERRGRIKAYGSSVVLNTSPVRIVNAVPVNNKPAVRLNVECRIGGQCLVAGEIDILSGQSTPIEIKWRAASEESDYWGSGRVLGTRLVPVFQHPALGELRGKNDCYVGQVVEMRFTLVKDGDVVSCFEDKLIAGEQAAYCYSAGTHPVPPKMTSQDIFEQLSWLSHRVRHELDGFERMCQLIADEDNARVMRLSKVSLCPIGTELGGTLLDCTGYELHTSDCTDIFETDFFGRSLQFGRISVMASVLRSHCKGELQSMLDVSNEEFQGECSWVSSASECIFSNESERICLMTEASTGIQSGWWMVDDSEYDSHIVRMKNPKISEELESFGDLYPDLISALGAVCDLQEYGLANHDGITLACLAVFGGIYRQAMQKPIMQNFEVARRKSAWTGRQVASIEIEADCMDAWQVDIWDDDGNCVYSRVGTGVAALVEWNGENTGGTICKPGIYIVRVTLKGRDTVSSCTKSFDWDALPPEVTLDTRLINDAGRRIIVVDSTLADSSGVTGRLQILNELDTPLCNDIPMEAGKNHTKIDVTDCNAQCCQVVLSATDGVGNESGAVKVIPLEAAYVNNTVIASDGKMIPAFHDSHLSVSVLSPAEDAVITSGIIPVCGSMSIDDENKALSCQIRLVNGEGDLLRSVVLDYDAWFLGYGEASQASEDLQVLQPIRQITGGTINGELATVDVSNLPNGKYTMQVIGIETNGGVSSVSVPLLLDVPYKIGKTEYAEDDGVVRAGTVGLALTRHYSSACQGGSVGVGWNFTLDSFDAVTDDKRILRKNSDGKMVSVRNGGSRNVSLTLPDGQRVTFIFNMEAGGMFGGEGYWETARDIGWYLTTSAGTGITALPGLEPFWDFTGVGVPMDYADFPDYILTSPDGTQYIFERENLGDFTSELSSEEGGGSVMITCYGDSHLRKIVTPDGKCVYTNDNSVDYSERNGARSSLLKLTRNDNGQIDQVDFCDGSGVRLNYTYDDRGNLVAVWRGNADRDMALKRTYSYSDRNYPHFLTAVNHPSGVSLATFGYDALGRQNSIGNGATAMAVEHNTVDRIEIMSDESGNESIAYYDGNGKIIRRIAPDGGERLYEYNQAGLCTLEQDELGRVTRGSYDGNGNLLSRTEPDGRRARYEYNSDGKCTQLVDTDGSIWTVAPSREQVQYYFPNGEQMTTELDGKDRVTKITADGNDDVLTLDYDDAKGATTVSNGNGQWYCVSREKEEGRVIYKDTWINPENERIEELTAEATFDSEGRLLSVVNSDGDWLENDWDAEGRALRIVASNGMSMTYKRNVRGQVVESSDERGFIRRYVYAPDGKLILAAVAERVATAEDNDCSKAIFSRAVRHSYDANGRPVETAYLSGVEIDVIPIGGECYDSFIADSGETLASESQVLDVAGQIARSTTRDGVVHAYEYDSMGRVIHETDSLGNDVTLARDDNGCIIRRILGTGEITEYDYDESGNLLAQTDADGRKTEMTRDAKGEIMRMARSGGTAIEFLRDENGRIVKAKQDQLIVNLTRDSFGRIIGMEASGGYRKTAVYDTFDRCVSKVTGSGRLWQASYIGNSREDKTIIDGNGVVSRYEAITSQNYRKQEYQVFEDSEPCLTIESWEDGRRSVLESGKQQETESFAYDSQQRIAARIVNGEVVARYSYDGLNRFSGYESAKTAFTVVYGIGDRIAERRYSRCGGEDLPEELIQQYRYDSIGRLVEEACTGCWSKEYEYDPCGRITKQRVTNANGDLLLELTCSYDEAGRLTWRLHKTPDGNEESSYNYDSYGRLVQTISCKNGSTTTTRIWRGEYDAFGNLLVERHEFEDETETLNHSYDADCCLVSTTVQGTNGNYSVSYEWDGNGALIREKATGSVNLERRYFWTADGYLNRVIVEDTDKNETEIVDFEYDARRLLRGHTMVRKCAGEEQQREIHEINYDTVMPVAPGRFTDYSVSGTSGNTCSTVLYGRGISCEVSAGIVSLGRMPLEGGSILGAEMDAWGMPLETDLLSSGPGAFGEWYEARSGLIYLRERMYSPRLRRFISPDKEEGQEDLPMSFHPYCYCFNDPVNYSDPTGRLLGLSLSTWCEIGYICVCANIPGSIFRILTDIGYAYEMYNRFPYITKNNANATVLVHGVGMHPQSWSYEFQDNLRAIGVNNQDFHEFSWSGFTYEPYGYVPLPNIICHTIAKYSLKECLMWVKLTGYRHVNVISHSWGTVLSRDAMNDMRYRLNYWFTMGSPLDTCMVKFHYDKWYNLFNNKDPVTRLQWIMKLMGYDATLKPLALSTVPNIEHVYIETERLLLGAHCCYWNEFTAINAIYQALRCQ